MMFHFHDFDSICYKLFCVKQFLLYHLGSLVGGALTLHSSPPKSEKRPASVVKNCLNNQMRDMQLRNHNIQMTPVTPPTRQKHMWRLLERLNALIKEPLHQPHSYRLNTLW